MNCCYIDVFLSFFFIFKKRSSLFRDCDQAPCCDVAKISTDLPVALRAFILPSCWQVCSKFIDCIGLLPSGTATYGRKADYKPFSLALVGLKIHDEKKNRFFLQRKSQDTKPIMILSGQLIRTIIIQYFHASQVRRFSPIYSKMNISKIFYHM